MNCLHLHSHRHGRDRYGRQRMLCTNCRSTWTVIDDGRRQDSRISEAKERRIETLLLTGASIHEIAKTVGVSRNTVVARRGPVKYKPRASRVKPGCCDWCGDLITKPREFDRRTRRLKHKFCDNNCYSAYMHERFAHRWCQRCGKERTNENGLRLTRGYCPGCYGLLRQYGFDEEAAGAHELNRLLRKEIRNVRCKVKD
jgi:transposase-like protein